MDVRLRKRDRVAVADLSVNDQFIDGNKNLYLIVSTGHSSISDAAKKPFEGKVLGVNLANATLEILDPKLAVDQVEASIQED